MSVGAFRLRQVNNSEINCRNRKSKIWNHFINDKLVASSSTSIAIEHRNVGLIFQHSALFPHKTVVENVTFAIRSSSKKEKHLIALEILKLLNIAKYENMYPNALSGGSNN